MNPSGGAPFDTINPNILHVGSSNGSIAQAQVASQQIFSNQLNNIDAAYKVD
jgi:hypothetical protein